MKTAGELLREKRLSKELDIATLAKRIHIKAEYLQALENSEFDRLPSVTTTKGYLRNYARALHLNPDTILAMFRRDFSQQNQPKLVPKGVMHPLLNKVKLINANLILVIAGILSFFLFLGFQLRAWLSLPRLELLQPLPDEVYGEKVTVKGTTDPNNTAIVNGQPVLVDKNGNFSLDLVFPAGTHSVIVQVENRDGKANLVERTFQVSK